jgi:pyruvate-formate lyase
MHHGNFRADHDRFRAKRKRAAMTRNYDFSMELNFTEAYRRTQGQHIAVREAKCLRAQFPAIFTQIQNADRLAGRVEWGAVGFSPHNGPPDCGYAYFCNELKIIDAIENGSIPRDQRDAVMGMLHFWKTESTQSKVEAAFTEKMIPVLSRGELAALPCNFKPMIAIPLYRMAGVFLNYRKLLSLGIPGLAAEAISYRDRVKDDGGDYFLFEAMLTAVGVVTDSCLFYRDQALMLAGKTADSARSAELRTLAGVLHNLTVSRPGTFYEALQLTWIYTLMCGSLELGRMDSFLGDFYVNDIERRAISEAEAKSLLHSLWRLINETFRVVDGRVIIGGKGRANEGNADALAMLIMEAARTYGKSVLPQLTLRFYEGMNSSLMDRALSLITEGYTYPLLYNDDVLVPAVAKAHCVPVVEAEQYMPLGCGEIVLDHMGYGTPSGALNVLKALEVTMRNGFDPVSGKQLGLATGSLDDFSTFEGFFKAFKRQLAHFIEILADQEELEYSISGEIAPFLYLSLLYDDCLARGRGMFNGGVRYLGGSLETYGNVNAADSLTAIKAVIFEQRLISPERLLEALDHNFVGYERERRLLLDQPKYGNDDLAADSLMVELHDFLCNTIRDQAKRTTLDWYLNVIINNSQNTTLGRWVGASADGRKAGAAMANANTPAGGNDRKGITALINSIVKPDSTIHAGSVQNLRFGKDFVCRDRGKFEAILKTYFKKGGSQAMVTVINRGDLEKALSNPESYRNLVVRVGGFSARYVELSKDVQLEILSRTTY